MTHETWNEELRLAESDDELYAATERSVQQIKRQLDGLPEMPITGICLLVSFDGDDQVIFMGAGDIASLIVTAMEYTLEVEMKR